MQYGLQLYSVRDIAKESVDTMLSCVSKIGYSMVESAEFYNLSSTEFKGLIDKHGLKMCSTHTSVRRIRDELDATIEYHKVLGCNDIVIPGAPIGTKQELDSLIDLINVSLPKIEAAGMKLHFHNHTKEFIPNADGLIPHDEIAARTNVFFEIDTFWAFNAGLDPLALMDKYADRIKFIHLKDGIPQDWGNPDSTAIGKSLGQGKAPVMDVLKKAQKMGFTMIVESDGLDPCGIDEVTRCIDYLGVGK